MNENNIMRLIQLAAPKIGITLFRNNVGVGWVGKIFKPARTQTVSVGPGDVVVYGARPLHSGLCVGSSDLIGFQNNTGRFVSVEVKTETGKPTPEQNNFLSAVNRNGGLGIIAHSVEEFNAAFTGNKKSPGG